MALVSGIMALIFLSKMDDGQLKLLAEKSPLN